MSQDYLDQMQAHVDAGGKLTHQNAVELLEEVQRLDSCDAASARIWDLVLLRLREAHKPRTKT